LKKETIKIVLICLFILSGYAVIALQWEATKPFRGEDKLIENLGAFFLFIASVLFFACYRLSSRLGKDTRYLHPKRNKFYLFLAILFFIGCGEEISWGQRIFDWQTPVFVQEMNAISIISVYLMTRNMVGVGLWKMKEDRYYLFC